VSELLRAVVLCNDAQLAPPDARDDRWRPVGDPMEAALLTAAARCGLDPERLRSAHPRVTEVPFDSTRLRMTTVHRRPGGGWLVAAKGAPEVVLAAGGPVEAAPDERAALLDAARALAADGYRVLAVAERVAAEQPAEPERGLRPLGLAALVDPVRAEAADTIAAFGRAGIRLVVITGDHPATAASVAGRLGVPTETVVVGDRFDPADAHRAGVFARIRPEQKLSIVAALQSRGDVVAMTGDGVNDAPALRAADIGVAMGRGGTEAARQAAALVLADDNLATVGRAVEEGRRIYANIRRFLVYALAGGLAEVLVMLAGPWFGLTVPLLPAQILWINMLTHGLPGVALGAEPADRNVMTDRPRRPDEAILGGCVARRILGIGALITTVAIGAALVAHAQGRAWQSILFTVLGLAQLGVALALRARGTGRGRNWGLDAAVALSLLLQLAALWLAPLRALLGTVALSQAEVGACAAVAAVPALIVLFTMRRKA
jgi:Ca2+-transporting ATPase